MKIGAPAQFCESTTRGHPDANVTSVVVVSSASGKERMRRELQTDRKLAGASLEGFLGKDFLW